MKKLLLIVMLMLTTSLFAQVDDFEDGTDEYEFEAYSNEMILKKIEDDMEFSCTQGGLCTLSATTTREQRFTTSVNFGLGSPFNNFGGNNGSGTTVVVPGTTAGANESQPYWGVQLMYSRGKCTQEVKVPRSIYIALNRYMYSLLDENGDTRKALDPAKEAMIMFYTTIVAQAKGCNTVR